MNVYCGIDFGTTNTVISLAGKEGNVIDLLTLPTTLFIPFEKDGITGVLIGDEALNAFINKKEGRYIHSIKRSLRDAGFTKTRINNRDVTIENIVALFLRELKKKIHEKWGIAIERAVVGRPVNFSMKEDENRLALKRLKEGFNKAGFINNLYLEEPIAASYCFEEILNDEIDSFLIMDFGGGTSDYSLVSYDSKAVGIEKYKVIKLDGIDSGGDHFDEVLMYKRICPLLAMGATYESYGNRLPMPSYIYNRICRWNNFIYKNTRDLNEEFHDYRYGSTDRDGVDRLYRVIKERETFDILGMMKNIKHNLTYNDMSSCQWDEYTLEFTIHEYINQTLEVRDRILLGLSRIKEFESKENIALNKIIITGGSSRNRTFLEYFALESRIHFDQDHFYSIAKGLSKYAHYKGLNVKWA